MLTTKFFTIKLYMILYSSSNPTHVSQPTSAFSPHYELLTMGEAPFWFITICCSFEPICCCGSDLTFWLLIGQLPCMFMFPPKSSPGCWGTPCCPSDFTRCPFCMVGCMLTGVPCCEWLKLGVPCCEWLKMGVPCCDWTWNWSFSWRVMVRSSSSPNDSISVGSSTSMTLEGGG